MRSSVPLSCPEEAHPGPVDIEFHEAPPSAFRPSTPAQAAHGASRRWFSRLLLPDGTDYLRWRGLSEFLVSPDGRSIAFRPLERASAESFQTYLVSQTLSFALLKQGIEPLHATAVVLDGKGVAFLGDCGRGKSTLGAAFVQAGHRLLTDDVLVIARDAARPNHLLAHPGPPRIKLYPRIASRLLDRDRTGTPMNWGTKKLILSLTPDEQCATAVPLAAIYILRQSGSRPAPSRTTIRTLSPRQACFKLIANTFNTVVTNPSRLSQQLDRAAEVAASVPVKSLSYPHRLNQLPAVVAAIRKDLVP